MDFINLTSRPIVIYTLDSVTQLYTILPIYPPYIAHVEEEHNTILEFLPDDIPIMNMPVYKEINIPKEYLNKNIIVDIKVAEQLVKQQQIHLFSGVYSPNISNDIYGIVQDNKNNNIVGIHSFIKWTQIPKEEEEVVIYKSKEYKLNDYVRTATFLLLTSGTAYVLLKLIKKLF